MKIVKKSIMDQVVAEITHAYDKGGVLALRKIDGIELTHDEWWQLMHERRYIYMMDPIAHRAVTGFLKFRYCVPLRLDANASDTINTPTVFDFTISLARYSE